MLHDFPLYLGLIVAILLLIMLANKIKVAYPVLLVLAGLAISFIPFIPVLHIESELIFIIFLPPLLYEASWAISWKELWKWRRIISSFAFVVVFFSAFSVALVANYCIPGFTLALGFLLGGIISPPDAVSAGAILKFVKVPRRFSSILEGESLLNDASSLIIFRFALIAVATGQFIWQQAAVSFAWMVVGGVGAGLLIAYVIMKMHTLLPTDANSDIILSLVTPYIIYITAEEIHSSGVLAVVSGGLFLSTHRLSFLSSTSRLRSINVWESFSFLLNGLVFMFIGLELPEIVNGLEENLFTAISYGLLVTAVLVIGRIISAYMAVVVTLIARNFITVADASNPGARVPLLLGWAGMRGVVSLAAALSIPVQLQDGAAFPHRNLILFITFIVILTTLLLQGLTLPYLIKVIHLRDPDSTKPEEELYSDLRKELAGHALKHLHNNYGDQLRKEPILQFFERKWEDTNDAHDTVLMSDTAKKVYLDILDLQRKILHERNSKDNINEEIIRKHLLYLDLEEEKLKLL